MILKLIIPLRISDVKTTNLVKQTSAKKQYYLCFPGPCEIRLTVPIATKLYNISQLAGGEQYSYPGLSVCLWSIFVFTKYFKKE